MKTVDKEESLFEDRPHHELRNASVISGTVVGATVGSIGGVVGITAAAVIGGLIGLVGGLALERENERAAARDRELDDVIGVTTPEIGAAETARDGLAAIASREAEGRREREDELLALNAALDLPPSPEPVGSPVAPPSHHRMRSHLHYEYPSRFAVGSMLFRPDF